jgi:hypothetical protein
LVRAGFGSASCFVERVLLGFSTSPSTLGFLTRFGFSVYSPSLAFVPILVLNIPIGIWNIKAGGDIPSVCKFYAAISWS